MSALDHPSAGSSGLHPGHLLHSLGRKASLTGRSSQRFQDQLDEQPIDDYVAFGWLRGIKDRALMLQLRKRTGNILAVPYSWFEGVEFDPSVGITLMYKGRRIEIRGSNLNAEVRPNVRLFDGITRQRVTWVQEASGTVQQAPTIVSPCIESIVG